MSGIDRVVLMFPGQSSRYPEMIEKLTADDPPLANIVAEASEILDRDLGAHFRSENPDVLARNRDVQVGVFLANHLHAAALAGQGVTAAWSVGLSLGEYNHLVHIGAITFAHALRLVDARGELYDRAHGGVMVSVFPLDAEIIEETIARLGLSSQVAIGLYNSPRQQVLSGERGAVEQVLAALEGETYFEAHEIESRIPMHAPVFVETGARFADLLLDTHFAVPRLPYVPNVRATVLDAPPADVIRVCLTAHVSRPVRWRASIDALAERVPNAKFVEVGPKAVLYNLFGRGWMPGTRHKTDSTTSWRAHVTALAQELHDGC